MTIFELDRMATNFSLDVLKLGKEMNDTGWENLSEWFVYSGLDVGKYIARSAVCFEEDDFADELKKALNKANETDYWLGVIYSAEIISKLRYEILKYKCNRIRIELSKALRNINN